MANNYNSNKEMLEANGWKELERGVYVSRDAPVRKSVAASDVSNGYWKKQLQEFKAEKLAGREKNRKPRQTEKRK